MKRILSFFLVIQISFMGWIYTDSTDYSIVFIHIGPELPSFLETAASQARLFNKDCPIYLIANEKALEKKSLILELQDLIIVPTESLTKTADHERFLNDSPGGPTEEGFWRWTSERFLYLDDMIQQYQLSNVFHLENDVMLYVDLAEIFPLFQKYYKGIAATFDHDKRCIPGFIYFDNPAISSNLAHCFAKEARHGHNDMGMIPICRTMKCPAAIEQLPIVPDDYTDKYRLVAGIGHGTSQPELYYNHFDEFQSIFDAAAIGQYFCSDPANRFINESAIFNPSFFEYEWVVDEEGRKVPFFHFEGRKFRVNNLHIHCKQLYRFTS